MSDESAGVNVSLEGRVVLVTGANTGLGYETALALAGMGARVLLHGRDRGKVDQAVKAIRQATGSEVVEGLVADLASMVQVKALAEEVRGRTERLHVLVNNAGIILGSRTETPEGLETTFAVNHLAPFLLTGELLGLLKAAAPARVVTVASGWHTAVRGLDFEDLQHARRYDGKVAYQRSKLANILFTRALAKRLEGRGVTANCLHPGVVRTRFGQDGDISGALAFFFRLARPLFLAPAAGARTSIYLASSPEVGQVSGEYFVKSKAARPSDAALDDQAAERLWAESERLLAAIAAG